MKREAVISLSAAVLSLAFLPAAAQASAHEDANSNSPVDNTTVQRMVPAQAVFTKKLDAKQAQQGQQFQVALNQKVKLKNGEELPSGTVLEGTIVSDEMHSNGNSKLVLRFTQAHLKDGKDIPIQAAITGVYSQGSLDTQYGSEWTPAETNIEQESAMDGFDLHSRIGATNSGTFESANKSDLKFNRGSTLSLAIAPAEGANTTNTAGE